jgi:hypothetical protein
MAANGKGNGKKGSSGSAPPQRAPEGGTNGKSNGAKAAAESEPPEAGPAESAPADPTSPASAPETAASAPAQPEDPGEPEAPVAPRPAGDALHGAAWGHPLARFEQKWTWLESRLLTFVLVWQILALVSWVFLNGLAESVTTTAGAVFRVVLVATTFGLGAWIGTKKRTDDQRTNLTLAAIAAAIALVILWRRAAAAGPGVALSFDHGLAGYFDNVKGWLQEGSTLTLLGGLRGLGTRLTLWLALLGGSLATGSGKHIHVDVVFRFLPKKLRMPVSVVNYVFAAAVCLAAVWGFFDHIAIESYGSRADDRPAAKIENALHHIGNHAFFTRKQIGLDLRSLPHVLAGQRYDQWMTAAAWNAWVDGAGFEDRFEEALVKNLRIPDGTHPPFVVSPDGETTRSALAHTLGLVFPFGLLAIGLRFLLRALLTLSGHIAADPDDAHREDIGRGDVPNEGGA